MLANALVRQPPDIAGSSFAAPMICGLAVLSPPVTHLAKWSDVLRSAAFASDVMALGDPKLQEKFPWEEPITALGALPAAENIPALSWMTHWVYINHAQNLMTRDYAQAREQAHKAVNAYDRTLEIRENHEVYSYWRQHCLNRLAKLTA
jgi:hypothetical protein